MSNKTGIHNVLVTGASGFIGKRLLGLLRTIDCEVRLISRKPFHNYDVINCDFESDSIPVSSFASIDTVFHLAGFAHDFRNDDKVDDLYKAINIDVTLQLAKLSIQAGVKNFIFVSSVKAGGKNQEKATRRLTEIDQKEPDGIYGKTKREAEIRLLELGSSSNMHIVIIRPSLVYGPGMKGNLKLMLAGIKKGWFPPLPKIMNYKSMIHVDDLVRALLMVANEKRTNGEIYIATDGKVYSSRLIYNTMCIAIGKKIPKWSVPKFLFILLSFFSKNFKFKIDKLLEDDCYSSEKLESVGFTPAKSLKDIASTDFL